MSRASVRSIPLPPADIFQGLNDIAASGFHHAEGGRRGEGKPDRTPIGCAHHSLASPTLPLLCAPRSGSSYVNEPWDSFRREGDLACLESFSTGFTPKPSCAVCWLTNFRGLLRHSGVANVKEAFMGCMPRQSRGNVLERLVLRWYSLSLPYYNGSGNKTRIFSPIELAF